MEQEVKCRILVLVEMWRNQDQNATRRSSEAEVQVEMLEAGGQAENVRSRRS